MAMSSEECLTRKRAYSRWYSKTEHGKEVRRKWVAKKYATDPEWVEKKREQARNRERIKKASWDRKTEREKLDAMWVFAKKILKE